MIRVPALRGGKAYYSRDVISLHDYATRAPIAEVGLTDAGLISRDLRRDDWSALQTLRTAEILDLFKAAAKHFMKDELPVGDTGQSPEDFVAAQSATTGLTEVLCRRNMEKIRAAMASMGETIDGLTEDPILERDLLALGDIGRLNLGPVPTTRIQWDQPHEGNIFESLFQQRAFQREPFATVGAMA